MKGSVRIEVMPPDEQPAAQATGTEPLKLGRDRNQRVRTSEAAAALARLPRKSKLPANIVCDPAFKPHNERRLEYQKKRVAEHHNLHGGVSYGVGAMLNHAAWLYAGAEFAAQMAAETGDMNLFVRAASLSSTARQHELAAWELGAREALSKRALSAQSPNNRLAALVTDGESDDK